ncbi:LSU ribosomal protein L28p [invertebrate metagenome]|uniref:LSU ribosomal protein L28p n=1 Tax=invertebrate metagenome TaxID=1711999 RepID=A0A484H6K7_9ZZZZ
MARRCAITGKGVLVGYNVSHANNKVKRRFLPNLQETAVWSDVLGRSVRLRLSINGLRSIEQNGGIDSYLRGRPDVRLPLAARRLKRQILSAMARRKAESSELEIS